MNTAVYLGILCIVAILTVTYAWFGHSKGIKTAITDHAYFTRLWLYEQGKEYTRWEAEQDIQSAFSNGAIGLYAEDNYTVCTAPEPTPQEIAFAKHHISNLALLFQTAYDGAQQGWQAWFQENLPKNWQQEFTIDGFSVPIEGNVNGSWTITLWCKQAGHYFCITVEDGLSRLDSIDG